MVLAMLWAISAALATPQTVGDDFPFPVRVSANRRYLEDARGKPFLLHGDSAWSMIVQLTKEDAEFYLEKRRQQGFNAIVVNLIEHYYAAEPPGNAYGVGPFASPGNFATPEEAYFAHADWVLTKAREKGFLVLLNPCYLGNHADGWWREVETNGPTKCRNYGRYLGQRYQNYVNIIWVAGGDQTPKAGSPRESNWLEILLGIKEHAPKHLWTAHWDNTIDSVHVAAFRPYMDVNGVYAYGVFEQRMLRGYNEAEVKPFYLWESWYEGLTWSGTVTAPETVRKQAYVANLSGSTGQNFGSYHVWSFGARTHRRNLEPDVDWKTWINKGGSLDMVRVKQLFGNRPWWKLVPDQKRTVVTAGWGTLGKRDYVTAARTTDGNLVMAYIPSTGTGARTITVDMAKLSGPAKARWYNPTTGTYAVINGSPLANRDSRDFTTPGDNGTGRNDWMLVLEAGDLKKSSVE